jgi:hypothetical protein
LAIADAHSTAVSFTGAKGCSHITIGGLGSRPERFSGWSLSSEFDLMINVPGLDTQRIQQQEVSKEQDNKDGREA